MHMKNQKHDIVFLIFLWGKAAYSFFEVTAGAFLLLVSHATIDLIFVSLTSGELSEDPHDFIASYVLKAGSSLTHGVQVFIGASLLAYGILKLLLVVGLFRDDVKIYPYAIGIFLAGIAYQAYRLMISFSVPVLVIVTFETLTLVFIMRHYRRLSSKAA